MQCEGDQGNAEVQERSESQKDVGVNVSKLPYLVLLRISLLLLYEIQLL